MLHPLDTSEYHTAPCRLLTANDTANLNLNATGEPVGSSLGNRCRWENPNTYAIVEIGFDLLTKLSLSALHAADQRGDYAYFDELPAIRGYPAVANDIVDDRDNGSCAVVVGVSDHVTFDVSLQLSVANTDVKDPRDTAATVAGMTVDTIQN